jgi:hypothetical protein
MKKDTLLIETFIAAIICTVIGVMENMNNQPNNVFLLIPAGFLTLFAVYLLVTRNGDNSE